MKYNKFFRWCAIAVICALLTAAGCVEPSKESAKPSVEPEKKVKAEKQLPKTAEAKLVTLALKFSPQDSTNYRVTTEMEDSVKLEGAMPDKVEAKDKRNFIRTELVFTQQIQSINDKGDAVANITIKGLKYLSVYKNDTVLDFDGSKDQTNPLAKLIGQSYTIEVAPTGEVVRVADVNQAKAAVTGTPAAVKAASAILDTEAIKDRHGMAILPVSDKNRLAVGGSWGNVKVFSFRMLGSKSYEKVYKLDKVSNVNGRQVAVVDMNAIPSSEMAEALNKEPSTAAITKMFDNTETYNGKLTMDATGGKVESYSEKLQTEWVMVAPSAKPADNEEPSVLKMRAVRAYSIEKID